MYSTLHAAAEQTCPKKMSNESIAARTQLLDLSSHVEAPFENESIPETPAQTFQRLQQVPKSCKFYCHPMDASRNLAIHILRDFNLYKYQKLWKSDCSLALWHLTAVGLTLVEKSVSALLLPPP
eukprot:5421882-Amphidinium_carterae.3